MSEKETPLFGDKIKLFGEWDCLEIEVRDPGLRNYINLRPILVPHSCGRHERRRFHKSHVHIVERLTNKLMSPGKNTGKKLLALKAVKTAFQIIHIKTNQNPIQVLVEAIENSAPREETTRISYGGIVYHSSVDSSPQRRVDIALRLISQAIRQETINNPKSFEEVIADQILMASRNNPRAYAIRRKQDIERVALSAR